MSTISEHHRRHFARTASEVVAFFVAITMAMLCRAGISSSQSPDKDAWGHLTNCAAARELGMAEARRDLSNGVLIVKTAGLPSPDRTDYKQLLQERCDAALQPIAGCIVTSELLAYMDGYNEVSTAAIRQRFGKDIFEELNRDARTRYEKRVASGRSRSPEAGTQTYTVKLGDTLSKIALDHGVGLKALLQANPKVEPTKLQVNQKLLIPTKAKP